jgi:hypothetical protein
MTQYLMSKMAAGIQPRVLVSGPISVLSILAFQAVALANGDNINALNLASDPAINVSNGPTILDVSVDIDQLDTGNTLSFTAGDATNHARFISASTLGRTGGIARANVQGTMGYQPFAGAFNAYPTQSLQTYTLQVWVTATATTPAAGSMRVKCDYTYDP